MIRLTPTKRPIHLKKYQVAKTTVQDLDPLGEDSDIGILYYNTIVVREVKDMVVFNTGGWQTTNTRLRMNTYLDLVYPGKGWRICQDNYDMSLERYAVVPISKRVVHIKVPFNMDAMSKHATWNDKAYEACFCKLFVENKFLSAGGPGKY